MSTVSVLSSLPFVDSHIRKLVVQERRTLPEVSRALKEAYPHVSRGLLSRLGQLIAEK